MAYFYGSGALLTWSSFLGGCFSLRVAASSIVQTGWFSHLGSYFTQNTGILHRRFLDSVRTILFRSRIGGLILILAALAVKWSRMQCRFLTFTREKQQFRRLFQSFFDSILHANFVAFIKAFLKAFLLTIPKRFVQISLECLDRGCGIGILVHGDKSVLVGSRYCFSLGPPMIDSPKGMVQQPFNKICEPFVIGSIIPKG